MNYASEHVNMMVVLFESYNAVANVAPALEFQVWFALGLPTPCDSPIIFRPSSPREPPRVGGLREEGQHVQQTYLT